MTKYSTKFRYAPVDMTRTVQLLVSRVFLVENVAVYTHNKSLTKTRYHAIDTTDELHNIIYYLQLQYYFITIINYNIIYKYIQTVS